MYNITPMKLKKITLMGFKSFPYKTVIEFNNGFNAIVGPNGIGKSNIIDAIKWVVGEKSIKELRGEKLEDVIFFGSEGKNPMNLAEVEIVFENNGLIPLDFEDVVVKRRYFRDGTSEFFINSTPCRLKDIVEKFANTGISYCIVDDNSIKRIILSDSKIRKELFESIANIGKYREDKKDALTRLQRVEEELSKIMAVIEEKEKNARSLQYQAKRASQYREIILELKEKLYLSGCNEIYSLLEKIKELKDAHAEINRTIQELNTKKENLLKERELTQKKINEKEYYLGEIKIEISHLENRKIHLLQEITRLETLLENIESSIKNLPITDVNLKEQEKILIEKRNQLDELEKENLRLKELENDLTLRLKELEGRINLSNLDQIRNKDRMNDKKNLLLRTEDENREMDKILAEVNSYRERLLSDLEGFEKELLQNSEIIKDKTNEREKILSRKSNILRIKEEMLRNKIKLEDELIKLKSRYDENKKEFCEKFNLRRLSEMVRIKAGYGEAFEGVLDILYDALIGKREEVIDAYNYAKEKNIKDVVFIIEEDLNEKSIDNELLKFVEEDNYSILLKIINPFKMVDKFNYDILKKKERMVTLDGDVYADGIIRIKRGQGILVLKENIEKMTDETERLNKEIIEKEREIEEITKVEMRLSNELEELNNIRNKLSTEKSNTEYEIARMELKIESYSEESNKKKKIIDELKKEIENIEKTLHELEENNNIFEQQKEDLKNQLIQNGKHLNELNEKMVILKNEISTHQNLLENARKVSELKMEKEEKVNYLNERKSELEELEKMLSALKNKSSFLDIEISNLRKSLDEYFEKIEEIERENVNLVSESKLKEKEIEDTGIKKEEVNQRIFRESEKFPEPMKIKDIEEINNDIKNLIDKKEKFGEVNPLAEEDYKIVKQEIDSMREKVEDLVNAREDILSAIKKIDSDAEGIFVRTINEIRKNFQSVFQRFFEDGYCDIRLVGTDPLSADIEITARPPGKKIKQLESLSEGEKTITAFSLLLGVVLTKKSGILILDEIDAPLDEKNIERFISVVRSLFGSGQIIVITHNRRTMDEADYIFGVTMEEKGVSKILTLSKEAFK